MEKVPKKCICPLFELKEFLYCKCILAALLQNGTILKDICFKKSTQFCSACSSSGLIYSGPTNWSFRRQIRCVNYFITTYYEAFLYFFANQFFQKYIYFFAF